MRTSEAALGLISRTDLLGQQEYLTQWNTNWRAYSLVGGHCRPHETFRDCCIRELEEELDLIHDHDFRVAEQPWGPPCEYIAFSKSAQLETQYRLRLYLAQFLTSEAMVMVSENSHNRWLREAEIQAGQTDDQRPIDMQVLRLLEHFERYQ